MTEPTRLFEDDDALKRLILRSSELDVPSPRALKRAHALALGIATSTVAGVGTAASGGAAATGALLGSAGTLKAIAIWAGVGVLSGALVSGTAVTVLDRGTPERREAPAATHVAKAQEARTPSAPVRTPGAHEAQSETVDEPDQRPDEPASTNGSAAVSGKVSGSLRGDPGTIRPLPETNPGPSAASYAPLPSPDELARELGMVDRARSALRSGDAAGALEQVARYERTFKRQRFAPEASAIRIEALIAQGRRAEAARLARSFMANHPGHPLTPRLREFLGETR